MTYRNLEKSAFRRQLIGAGIGAVAGGGAGYLGSSRGAHEDEESFGRRRLGNTLIGGALGGALGGGIGHMTGAPRHQYYIGDVQSRYTAEERAELERTLRRLRRQRLGNVTLEEVHRLGGLLTQGNARLFRTRGGYLVVDRDYVPPERDPAKIVPHWEAPKMNKTSAWRDLPHLARGVMSNLREHTLPDIERESATTEQGQAMMSELYGYRHREKRAALRDRLAMGAGVIGNLALQGRDAFNHAASAVRGGAPLLQSVEGATAHARNQLMGRTEAYDSRFTPLYPGHLTGDSNIGKTLGTYYHPADSSPLTNTVRREYINDPRVGDDDITRGLGTRLSALSGNLAGRDLSIVPTGALSPSPAFYHRDEPGLVAAGNMPALLHELGHHAVPPTPLMRTMAPYAPRFAKLLHEADAQNWAEERMTDPRYHASHGMDRPRGQLNPDASMADNGVGALRALSQGDVGTARARAEDLLNSSAALSTYGSHAAYHAPSLVGAALGAGAGLIGRGVRALRGS